MVYSHWLGPEPGPGQVPGRVLCRTFHIALGPRRMSCMVLIRTIHTAPEQGQGRTLVFITTNNFRTCKMQGSYFFYPIKFSDFSLILVKKNHTCGLSDISLSKYCLIKCNFLIVPEKRFYSLKKKFSQIKRFESGFEKKFPDLKILSLILAENPLFFPDWKKSLKFSLISLISGNPENGSGTHSSGPENVPGVLPCPCSGAV